MQHINDIAHEILKAEGGIVNDPDDPGGPTNYGVTLKTLKRLGHDLNQDGRVDIADLNNSAQPKRFTFLYRTISISRGLINCPICSMHLCLICM